MIKINRGKNGNLFKAKDDIHGTLKTEARRSEEDKV